MVQSKFMRQAVGALTILRLVWLVFSQALGMAFLLLWDSLRALAKQEELRFKAMLMIRRDWMS